VRWAYFIGTEYELVSNRTSDNEFADTSATRRASNRFAGIGSTPLDPPPGESPPCPASHASSAPDPAGTAPPIACSVPPATPPAAPAPGSSTACTPPDARRDPSRSVDAPGRNDRRTGSGSSAAGTRGSPPAADCRRSSPPRSSCCRRRSDAARPRRTRRPARGLRERLPCTLAGTPLNRIRRLRLAGGSG